MSDLGWVVGLRVRTPAPIVVEAVRDMRPGVGHPFQALE